jgi:hypothetical protein
MFNPVYGPRYSDGTPSTNLSPSLELALLAHLRDYIMTMDLVWPYELDAVKSRAKALLADCMEVSEHV